MTSKVFDGARVVVFIVVLLLARTALSDAHQGRAEGSGDHFSFVESKTTGSILMISGECDLRPLDRNRLRGF